MLITTEDKLVRQLKPQSFRKCEPTLLDVTVMKPVHAKTTVYEKLRITLLLSYLIDEGS